MFYFLQNVHSICSHPHDSLTCLEEKYEGTDVRMMAYFWHNDETVRGFISLFLKHCVVTQIKGATTELPAQPSDPDVPEDGSKIKHRNVVLLFL